MVHRQLVEERWLIVGPELDVCSLGAPVAAELVGAGPRHQRVEVVAVDEHRGFGLEPADALQIEQALERFVGDHLVRVAVEVLLQVVERERQPGFDDALVLGLVEQVFAIDGELVVDGFGGLGIGGDRPVDEIADRADEDVAVDVRQ